MKTIRSVAVLSVLGTAWLIGCASNPIDDNSSGDTQDVVPQQNDDPFEQVKVCDNLFKDRAAFRQVDLDQGVLRWKCGDVDRVTISSCEDDLDKIAAAEKDHNVDTERDDKLNECGDGFGQEYCEYNAVSKGNVVNTVTSAKGMKDADVVECVFTSVHSDVKGSKTATFDKELASQLKTQLTTPERDLEGRVAGMKQGVNSRGAADTLIADCSGLAPDAKLAKNAERQVRCYNAWSAAKTDGDKKKLQTACAGHDLSDDAAFAKTGLDEKTTLDDGGRDLAACSMVLNAPHGGVSWRNSDPTICARSYRAAHECGVKFKGIGDVAPDFQGFSMQGWANRDTLPAGCKYAQVDGKDYQEIVVCKPNPQDVKTFRTQKKPLQQLCRDKFGLNVAMQAPMGALSDLSKAKTDTDFCTAFVAGAKKAQGK